MIVKSPAGIKLAQLVGSASGGFLSLSAAMRVNAAGILTFNLRAGNPVIDQLEDDSQVEMWRNETMLFRTLYQGPPQYTVDERDQELFIATCYGEKDLLNRAIIAWESGTQNRATFTEMRAESIMYTLVKYNVTADATTENGRIVSNPFNVIALESDLGRGESLTRDDMSGKPLLQELQDIAKVGDVDFDLVQTGAQTWTFRVYPGQIGVDRTEEVVFSRTRKNMGQIAYNPSPQDPRTVIVVGGGGEGAEREYAARYGPDYSSTYHREYFHSHTSEAGSTAMLQAAGDKVAQEKRSISTLSFQPLQVAGTRYGIDYNLGDLVRGTHRDISATYQVVGVSINVSPGQKEDIAVELEQQ